MRTCATPATKAASVPGRTGSHSSTARLMRSVWQGSTDTTLRGSPSAARASRICSRRQAPLAPPIRVREGLAPNTTSKSALATSSSVEPL